MNAAKFIPPSADAEFLTVEGVTARFGLCESHTYKLLKGRKIEGISIKEDPCAIRGKRLFYGPSISKHLNDIRRKQNPEGIDPLLEQKIEAYRRELYQQTGTNPQ